ncbi:hypothetical protein BC937DRAFT_87380 [Endogone sp. FLAS-F59071]|nr:hypothetical protein BC937DRAFT_87380 [Endogone sp. FLAS-F59071]|eukprot:RUS19500.1 hypothetical protein BC937DRAFT_87380 [Endogone sp. FLAS-F59071]
MRRKPRVDQHNNHIGFKRERRLKAEPGGDSDEIDVNSEALIVVQNGRDRRDERTGGRGVVRVEKIRWRKVFDPELSREGDGCEIGGLVGVRAGNPDAAVLNIKGTYTLIAPYRNQQCDRVIHSRYVRLRQPLGPPLPMRLAWVVDDGLQNRPVAAVESGNAFLTPVNEQNSAVREENAVCGPKEK